MALAEVDTSVGVVGTWLLDASGGSGVGVLVHGRLHLLQELVDVHQVVLGSHVGKGQSVLVLRHGTAVTAVVTTVDRHHLRGRVHVFEAAAMDRNTRKTH